MVYSKYYGLKSLFMEHGEAIANNKGKIEI
jgi:hypothetical protein